MARKKNHKTENIRISHSMTHYLLVIHDLKESRGYARVTDISKELNITKGSVSTAVQSLKEKGYIEEEKDSKFLKLTDFGHNEAHFILSSRALLYSFFKDFLKVNNKIAKEGSCIMEHLISHEIREKFFYFMRTISLPNKDLKKKKLISEIQAFETDLNLMKYKSVTTFIHDQTSQF